MSTMYYIRQRFFHHSITHLATNGATVCGIAILDTDDSWTIEEPMPKKDICGNCELANMSIRDRQNGESK